MAEMIVLRLAGPFQSWGGEYEINDMRGTCAAPTKSGVVGLIACAMGLRRKDPKIYEMCQAITMATRTDRSGQVYTDLHTVKETMQADGKIRKSPVVSHRKYITDACFTVFVEASDKWLDEIETALKNPVWPVFLGRASCVPTEPVFIERTNAYESLLSAIFQYPLSKRASRVIAYDTETPSAGLSTYTQPDIIGKGTRKFIQRKIWKGSYERSRDVQI